MQGIRIGLITAPRPVSYLGDTLRSMFDHQPDLRREDVKVFSDTVKPPPDPAALGVACECRTQAEVDYIRSHRLLGHLDGTSNLMRALQWSLESNAPYACFTEDDLEHAPHWVDRLVECGKRLDARSSAWLLIPHFLAPANNLELYDDESRYTTLGAHCVLRWAGQGLGKRDYAQIGIGSQCCFMPADTARLVLKTFERAREYHAYYDKHLYTPNYYAMDIGLMKMSHALHLFDLCVCIPCLIQHTGVYSSLKEGRVYGRFHANRYFPGNITAKEAVEAKRTAGLKSHKRITSGDPSIDAALLLW